MKKIGQLMKDLGFNESAPDSVKEAFLKHLMKESLGVSAQTPSEKKEIQRNPDKIILFPQQLSFEFEEKPVQKSRKSK